MTQEEKQLLLVDLCARLPYEPMCEFTDTEDDFCTTTARLGYSLRDFVAGKVLIKPYLRPMSSMTEEEREEFYKECEKDYKIAVNEANRSYKSKFDEYAPLLSSYHKHDWLNANHFDYRGLIPIGLALEAPEDMYKIK